MVQQRKPGTFVKGDPRAGRPKGTQNAATVEVKAMARALIEDPEYQRDLKARLRSRKLPPAVESMLWAYAYGKPIESVRLSGEDGGPISWRIVETPPVAPSEEAWEAQQRPK